MIVNKAAGGCQQRAKCALKRDLLTVLDDKKMVKKLKVNLRGKKQTENKFWLDPFITRDSYIVSLKGFLSDFSDTSR